MTHGRGGGSWGPRCWGSAPPSLSLPQGGGRVFREVSGQWDLRLLKGLMSPAFFILASFTENTRTVLRTLDPRAWDPSPLATPCSGRTCVPKKPWWPGVWPWPRALS